MIKELEFSLFEISTNFMKLFVVSIVLLSFISFFFLSFSEFRELIENSSFVFILATDKNGLLGLFNDSLFLINSSSFFSFFGTSFPSKLFILILTLISSFLFSFLLFSLFSLQSFSIIFFCSTFCSSFSFFSSGMNPNIILFLFLLSSFIFEVLLFLSLSIMLLLIIN